MNIHTLPTVTFASALLLAPCQAAQWDDDPVYQALPPALQEEVLNSHSEPTKEESSTGWRSLADLVLNELRVVPGSPNRCLCSPDNRHIVQVYDNASGAITLHCIIYNRMDNGLWKQGKEYSFMTRYARLGELQPGPDAEGIKMEFIDDELGLTIPEHVPYHDGHQDAPETISYRAQHESDRSDSVLTPLTSEVSANNLGHVCALIKSRKVNMSQTDAYGRNAVWYAHTPEMQQLLTATDPDTRDKAVDQGSRHDEDYVRTFQQTEEGRALHAHLSPYGWEGMNEGEQRTCIERFRMLPPALQKELLAEPVGKAEHGLAALLVDVLTKLELKWNKHVMMFPEEGGRIAIQSGCDHTSSRTLTVYTRNDKSEWLHTNTFTMETAHANLSDFSLRADGADITVADPDFGIGFTERFKYTEAAPVHQYRNASRAQSLNTALNEEVKQGHLRYVHLMLESGKVNPNDRDIHGDTALDCACSAEMTELLKARGATKRGGRK